MSGTTKIEWCDKVWNPVTGCTKVSEGCRNCYAERIAGRFWGERKFSQVQCHGERLSAPFRWRGPKRVFVNSMSDLFHDDVPYEFIKDVWLRMYTFRKHTYMVLTKRPERMYEVLPYIYKDGLYSKNVWLGVSVENQKAADERIPWLLRTPAAIRFVSVEPMLGEINLNRIKWAKIPVDTESYKRMGVPAPDDMWSLNDALMSRPGDQYNKPKVGLDWVICGGETGPGARPMHPDWARGLRDQCHAAGVPFFFKSWGDWFPAAAQYADDDFIDKLDFDARTICLGNRGTIYSDERGDKQDFWCGYQTDPDQNPWFMEQIGKKASGRLLDGREWNEFPGGLTS